LEHDIDMATMLERIVDQVGGASLERISPDGKSNAWFSGDRQPVGPCAARSCCRRRSVVDHDRKIGAGGFLTAFTAREIKVFVQQMLHFGDVLPQCPYIG